MRTQVSRETAEEALVEAREEIIQAIDRAPLLDTMGKTILTDKVFRVFQELKLACFKEEEEDSCRRSL
jgi:hypothetical protein